MFAAAILGGEGEVARKVVPLGKGRGEEVRGILPYDFLSVLRSVELTVRVPCRAHSLATMARSTTEGSGPPTLNPHGTGLRPTPQEGHWGADSILERPRLPFFLSDWNYTTSNFVVGMAGGGVVLDSD